MRGWRNLLIAVFDFKPAINDEVLGIYSCVLHGKDALVWELFQHRISSKERRFPSPRILANAELETAALWSSVAALYERRKGG